MQHIVKHKTQTDTKKGIKEQENTQRVTGRGFQVDTESGDVCIQDERLASSGNNQIAASRVINVINTGKRVPLLLASNT